MAQCPRLLFCVSGRQLSQVNLIHQINGASAKTTLMLRVTSPLVLCWVQARQLDKSKD